MILREPARALDTRMRKVWTVQGALATLVLAILVAGGVAAARTLGAEAAAWLVALAGGAVVGASGLLLVWLLPTRWLRHFRYEVNELGLYVASGWLWRRWQVVPRERIETVDVTTGPLLRAFGLVSVRVETAAAGGGTGIPGLAREAADELVAELARRADGRAA